MKTLPDNYRITEADCKEAGKLFWNKATYVEVMGKRDYRATLISAFVHAAKMKEKSGVWPTLGEVYTDWRKDNEACEAARDKVIQRQANAKDTKAETSKAGRDEQQTA
jgi:hypothetical protein